MAARKKTKEQIELLQKEFELEEKRLTVEKMKAEHKRELVLKELELEEKKLTIANLRDERAKAESSAEAHLTYTFYDEVTDKSARKCMAELGKWARRCPKKPIELILNSPGGSTSDGLAIYDFLKMLSSQGHFITVTVFGEACSMGSVILQAGDKRVLGRGSFVLIHEVLGWVQGGLGVMSDNMELVEKIWDHLASILAERSTLTVKEIKARAHRRDWWLTAAEAVELGFADEVI